MQKKPPKRENAKVTLEKYKRKHRDFKGIINGVRYVTKLTRDKGTVLLPIEEDKHKLKGENQ